MLLTEPLDVPVVMAAQVAEATGPFRTSLPSMFGAAATGSPAVAALGLVSAQTATTAPVTIRTSITPYRTAACRLFLSISPAMTIEAIGRTTIAATRQQVAPGGRVLERVGRVRAEEAAAVGAGLLDRHQRGHRAAGDGLGLHLGGRAVERRRLGRRLERHRHARADQQDGDDHGHGHEDVRPGRASGRGRSRPGARRRAARGAPRAWRRGRPPGSRTSSRRCRPTG